MINQIPGWVGIVILGGYGVYGIVWWIFAIKDFTKIVKLKKNYDPIGIIPEPLATYELIKIGETIELLFDSFDGFDLGFGGDC